MSGLVWFGKAWLMFYSRADYFGSTVRQEKWQGAVG